MNLKRLLLLLVCSAAAYGCRGQQETPMRTLVLYDPLFWSHELRLNNHQYKKIREINHEYYERLIEAVEEEPGNRGAFRLTVAKCLLHRSQSIWETFSTKQKRKWIKLWRDRFRNNLTDPMASSSRQLRPVKLPVG
jgi:hypothetical protein